MSVIQPAQVTTEPFDVPARARVAISVDDHGLNVAIILEGDPGHVLVQHEPIVINAPRLPSSEAQLRREIQAAHDALPSASCDLDDDQGREW